MNVLDSSGWLEYFSEGANTRFFSPVALDTKNLLVPSICIYEVFKKALTQFGEETALQTITVMSLGQVVDLDRDLAVSAAQLSLETKLAMADSIILATAQAHAAVLWTQDEHFKNIPGVQYIEKK